MTIVAVLLPFVDTKGVPLGSNTLIQNTEGVVLLILAVTALLTLYRRLTGARWWWATAAIGLVMIAVVIYTATTLPELSVGSNPFLEQETIKPSAGVGVYLAGLGAFLVTLGGFGLPAFASARLTKRRPPNVPLECRQLGPTRGTSNTLKSTLESGEQH